MQNWLNFSFLTFALTFLALPASAIKLIGDPKALACARTFLDDSILEYLEAPHGSQAELAVGTFVEVEELLQAAGLIEPAEILGVIDDFLSESDDLVMNLLRPSLSYAITCDTSLIVCVLKGECRLKNDFHSRYIFHTDGFFDFSSNGHRVSDHGPLRTLADETSRTSHAIVANPLPPLADKDSQDHWLAFLVSNLARYSSFSLIRDWLTANVARLTQGLKPDELFEKYVSFQKGQLLVDLGFAQILSVSVAHRTQLEFYHFQWKDRVTTHLHRAVQSQAMSELISHRRWTRALMNRLNVRQETILQASVPWTELMLKTIQETKFPKEQWHRLH